MPVPTAQQALDAFAVCEARKLGVAYVRQLGKWVALDDRREPLKSAGRHDDAWSALLAAETVTAAGVTLQQQRADSRLIAAVQTGLFTVRPRTVVTTEGNVKVFDVLQNGTPSSIIGRSSWRQAVVDAIALFGIQV